MDETANPRSSAEFAQYQRNAFKCPVMLSSLWVLINTCKLAYLPALSYGESGGMTVRQRRSSGQSELNLWFAHEWACHLCLPGGPRWGWDKSSTAGWQAEGFVKSGLVAVNESVVGEKEQAKYQWCPDMSQRPQLHIISHCSHNSCCCERKGGNKKHLKLKSLCPIFWVIRMFKYLSKTF